MKNDESVDILYLDASHCSSSVTWMGSTRNTHAAFRYGYLDTAYHSPVGAGFISDVLVLEGLVTV